DGEEKTAGTNPLSPDTDGDGLKDGDEVKIYKTNPLKADTDGDGLNDGFEVLNSHTDPTKVDSDGDGFPDQFEIFAGSDPNNAASTPDALTSIGVFTGGDPGEGLDLDGNFVYALAIGADPGSFVPVKIRDAEFQALVDAEAPGATLQDGNQMVNWCGANYGDTENDMNLAMATSSIRWSAAASAANPEVVLTLENLEKGGTYKVQLM